MSSGPHRGPQHPDCRFALALGSTPRLCPLCGDFGRYLGLTVLCVCRLAWKCTGLGSQAMGKERRESWNRNVPLCWVLG